jgi:transcriptional regulator with XRE-family HTH domain
VPNRKPPRRARDTLAHNLRRLRAHRGISQEELADLAGLHRTYVGSVERSERNISIDNIERLAAALKIAVPDLLSATLALPEVG